MSGASEPSPSETTPASPAPDATRAGLPDVDVTAAVAAAARRIADAALAGVRVETAAPVEPPTTIEIPAPAAADPLPVETLDAEPAAVVEAVPPAQSARPLDAVTLLPPSNFSPPAPSDDATPPPEAEENSAPEAHEDSAPEAHEDSALEAQKDGAPEALAVPQPPAHVEPAQIATSEIAPRAPEIVPEIEEPATPPERADAPSAAQPLPVETTAEPVESESAPAPVPTVRAWTWQRLARLAGLAVAVYFAVVFTLILLYRFVNPPATTLIAYQWLTGTSIEQTWLPIEVISPNLLRAVVISEDWGFCDHYGVDLDAIEKALELAGEGKMARGASTISMQVIKNLFLSQSKSYVRKAVEIPLTFVAEAVWPKSRMLEIYLNIAEWGPGIFGAEAAAQHHFAKSASRLSDREAALLAAVLPNPILRDAGDPGRATARKATVIQVRMRAAGPVADCAMPPKKPANAGSGWETVVKKRAGAVPGL